MSATGLYLLIGEPFLADEALDRIRAGEETDPLTEEIFTPASDAASIQSALETPSLLGGKRLVIVQNASSLTKDQLAVLERFVSAPSPDVVLIVISAARTKLDAAIKRSGSVISLEVPKGKRLVTWLRGRAREQGLKIDDRAAWAMVDAIGADLRELDSALVQLSTQFGPDAKIGTAEVRRTFSRLADERIFALTDAVGERRLPVAMGALRRLLEQGDEPLMILGAITSHFRRLLFARRSADQGPRAVADALGMPAWRAEKIHRQARSFKEEELIDAVGVLAETDVELKSGGNPEMSAAALEKAVVRIVAGARPATIF